MWIELKNKPLPQQTSSTWIVKNISKNSNIGMENVPIYQFEPDFILKEFYNRQYHPSFETTYNYFIVNKDSKILPEYIILSNVLFEEKYYPKSMKSNLVKRLLIENYKEIAYFPLEIPNYQYFDNYFYYPYLGLFAYPDGISIYKKP